MRKTTVCGDLPRSSSWVGWGSYRPENHIFRLAGSRARANGPCTGAAGTATSCTGGAESGGGPGLSAEPGTPSKNEKKTI